MKPALLGLLLAGASLLSGTAQLWATDERPADEYATEARGGSTRPATTEEIEALHHDYAALCRKIYLLSEYREPGIFEGMEGAPQATFQPDPNDILPGKVIREWRRYQDEYLSFLYPIPVGGTARVEVSGSEDIMSGILANSHRFWSRGYQIIGGAEKEANSPRRGEGVFEESAEEDAANVCLDMWLTRAERFRCGDWFCNPVVFTKYLFHRGSFFRFDVTGPGKFKWLRVLRGGMHVGLSASVHLSIDQDLYTAIGLSVRIKRPACEEATCRKMIADRYGLEGMVGLIEPGMTVDQLTVLLGKPVERRADAAVFRGVHEARGPGLIFCSEGKCRTTVELPLKEGRFVRFKGPPKMEQDWLDPERGSLGWIVESANEYRSGTFDAPPKVERLKPDDVRLIFDRFAELAPKACPKDWDVLCEAMEAMAKAGHRDGRVMTIVRKRIFNPNYASIYAMGVVMACEPDHRKAWELMASAARKILADTPADWEPDDPDETDPNPMAALWTIPEITAPMPELLKAAMRHPNPFIRLKGYERCRKVLGKETIELLRAGLEDEFYRVRKVSARTLGECWAEDPAAEGLLAARLEKEKVGYVRDVIAEALKKVRAGIGVSP